MHRRIFSSVVTQFKTVLLSTLIANALMRFVYVRLETVCDFETALYMNATKLSCLVENLVFKARAFKAHRMW